MNLENPTDREVISYAIGTLTALDSFMAVKHSQLGLLDFRVLIRELKNDLDSYLESGVEDKQ